MPFPGEEAALFVERQQATRDSQRLPATLVVGKHFSLLSFFPSLPVLGMVADPECCPNTVNLADTHPQVKALLQESLDGGRRCLGSLPTLFFKKSACSSTQFARIPVPTIKEGSFTEQSIALKQSIGC